MSDYERLSPMERERVDHDAEKALYEAFNAAHNAVGWCGDIMEECWKAGLPVLKEAFARIILRTR